MTIIHWFIISNKNCHFVIYEKLDNSNDVKKILKKVNIVKNENINLDYFKNLNKKKITTEYDKNIYNKSISIYKNFL